MHTIEILYFNFKLRSCDKACAKLYIIFIALTKRLALTVWVRIVSHIFDKNAIKQKIKRILCQVLPSLWNGRMFLIYPKATILIRHSAFKCYVNFFWIRAGIVCIFFDFTSPSHGPFQAYRTSNWKTFTVCSDFHWNFKIIKSLLHMSDDWQDNQGPWNISGFWKEVEH